MKMDTKYWLWLTASLVIAFLAWGIPARGMPVDYQAVISTSIPLAVVWSLALAFGVRRYSKRGLWLLLGAPMALYWPIWLLFNHFPPCYYTSSCA